MKSLREKIVLRAQRLRAIVEEEKRLQLKVYEHWAPKLNELFAGLWFEFREGEEPVEINFTFDSRTLFFHTVDDKIQLNLVFSPCRLIEEWIGRVDEGWEAELLFVDTNHARSVAFRHFYRTVDLPEKVAEILMPFLVLS